MADDSSPPGQGSARWPRGSGNLAEVSCIGKQAFETFSLANSVAKRNRRNRNE